MSAAGSRGARSSQLARRRRSRLRATPRMRPGWLWWPESDRTAPSPPRSPSSTSVGSNAIQLAVAAGYEVITTSSPRNFDYVKKLGASQVFDYNSKTSWLGSNRLLSKEYERYAHHTEAWMTLASIAAAARFCSAHDEARAQLRYRHPLNETVSLADQRRLFQERGARCAPCCRRRRPRQAGYTAD